MNIKSYFEKILLFIRIFLLCLILFILESYFASFLGFKQEFKPNLLLVLLVLLSLKRELLSAFCVFLISLVLFISFTSGEHLFLSYLLPILVAPKLKSQKNLNQRGLYKDLFFLFLLSLIVELVNFVYFVIYERSIELISGLKIILISPLIQVLIGLPVSLLISWAISPKKKEVIEFD